MTIIHYRETTVQANACGSAAMASSHGQKNVTTRIEFTETGVLHNVSLKDSSRRQNRAIHWLSRRVWSDFSFHGRRRLKESPQEGELSRADSLNLTVSSKRSSRQKFGQIVGVRGADFSIGGRCTCVT